MLRTPNVAPAGTTLAFAAENFAYHEINGPPSDCGANCPDPLRGCDQAVERTRCSGGLSRVAASPALLLKTFTLTFVAPKHHH